MAQKSISQLDTITQAHDTDLFEVAAVDAQSASGYKSGKMSAEVMAEGLLSTYTYPTAMPDMQNRTITGALNTLLSNFAPIYDSTSTYAVGDVVTYNGALYQCNTDISVAEAWNSTHWDAVKVSELSGLQEYSTTEKVVGTWIDGSPVYEKTIVETGVSMSSTDIVDIETISDIMLISASGYFVENGIYYALPDPALRVDYKSSTSALRLTAKGAGWSGDAYVTIRYIKTF